MHFLLPPLLYLAAALVIFLSSSVQTGLAIAGIPIALLGIFITIYHSRLFARIGTNIITFKPPEKLVQSGLFQFTRNPMYLGFSLSLVGLALSFSSAIAWIVTTMFIVVSDRWYIRVEEEQMQKTFGEAYERYRAMTPRWLGIRKKAEQNTAEPKSP